MNIHPSFFDSELHWPPQPHPLTELFLSSQNEWDVEQWRRYARMLEEAGHYLLEALKITQEELQESERKKSRTKRRPAQQPAVNPPPGKASLTNARYYAWQPPEPKLKRGRKKNENLPSSIYARLIIEKQAEQEAKGRLITDLQALNEVCDDKGLTRMQRQLIISRQKTIRNRLAKLKKSR